MRIKFIIFTAEFNHINCIHRRISILTKICPLTVQFMFAIGTGPTQNFIIGIKKNHWIFKYFISLIHCRLIVLLSCIFLNFTDPVFVCVKYRLDQLKYSGDLHIINNNAVTFPITYYIILLLVNMHTVCCIGQTCTVQNSRCIFPDLKFYI